MANRVKDPHAKDPRKLPSGRWQARVTFYDPDTGKRHETSQTFPTEREAKRWSREQEAFYREKGAPRQDTFGEYLEKWLEGTAAVRVRDTTAKAYRRYARPLFQNVGHKPLQALTPGDFQAIYTAMLKDGKATSTIHHTHVVAHSALAEAVNWGLIPFNPVDRIKPPRVVSPEIVPPTLEESKALLAAAEGSRLKALWWFIAITGCRRGEAVALKWSDIDWDRRVVTIRRTAAEEEGLLTVHDTKTAKGRRAIAVTEYLLDILQEHRERLRVERDVAGIKWNPDHWVFPSRKGTMLWPTNVATIFRKLRKTVGCRDDIKIHSLRHAMATDWLIAGVPIKVVSERLGHANIAITLQIYGHLLCMLKRARKREPAVLGKGVRGKPLVDGMDNEDKLSEGA